MGAIHLDHLHLWKLLQTLQKLVQQVSLQLTESGRQRSCNDEIKFRERRNALFPSGYFNDPAWDILLDLYKAHCAGRTISTTGLGLGGGVPQTTMLRHLNQLVEDGLAIRVNDPRDRRRVFVELTETGGDAPQATLADLSASTDALAALVNGNSLDARSAATL